jgi:hypothetical protein
MQLKEYFEKYEINPTLWAKRHGMQPAHIHGILSGKYRPGFPTRCFIENCTSSLVTERDWLDLFFNDPSNREIGTVDLSSLAVEESHSPQPEASHNGMATLRDDAYAVEGASREAALD